MADIGASKMLNGFNHLRSREFLTDITVTVRKCDYIAHRVVLAANCEYFAAMFNFNQNLQRPQNNPIILDEVSSTGFKILLDYMYTSEMALTEENIVDTLEAAHYLQVNGAMSKCSKFLEINLTNENCLDTIKIAETFDFKAVRIAAYRNMCGQLSTIRENYSLEDFSAEHVENILKCDLPVDCTESHLLYTIIYWFFSGTDQELSGRLQCVERILKHVRYDHIPQREMNEIVEHVKSNCNTNNPLYTAVLEYMSTIKSVGTDLSCSSFNSRGMEIAFIKVERIGINVCYHNTFNFCFVNQQKWKYIKENSADTRIHYSSAVLSNELYVIGGVVCQGGIMNYSFKYSPRINLWKKIDYTHTSRCCFSLTVCDGKLYAIGGIIRPPWCFEPSTDICERLDPRNGSWEYIAALPVRRHRHAATAVSINGEHRLYVSGGEEDEQVMGNMYSLDTSNDTWLHCAPMLTPRKNHFMLVQGSKIYICGGSSHLDYWSNISPTIDVYNCLTDNWETVALISNPLEVAGIEVCESNIYVVREVKDESTDEYIALADCYDVTNNLWTYGAKEVDLSLKPSTNVLYVPKSRNPNYQNSFI